MEIISAPTDLNAPLHYFPHMSTMAKSLSPPGLEQLDNDVDISSSPTTSYSCPLLSSISPDRLKGFSRTVRTPEVTAPTETTSSPSKSSPPVAMASASHTNSLPPLDLSKSPEKIYSPEHAESAFEDQTQNVSHTESDLRSHVPVSRESWVQLLQHMSSLYNTSVGYGSSNVNPMLNCVVNRNNLDPGEYDSECVNSELSTHSTNTSPKTRECSEASLPDSRPFDPLLRFQSMLNDMTELISNQNRPGDRDIPCSNRSSLFTGTDLLSSLPESLKSILLLMNSTSDYNAKPVPMESATTPLPEEGNFKSGSLSDDRSHISANFSSQNSVLPPEFNFMVPKPDRASSLSTPLDFTAFLATLTASHKSSPSYTTQRNQVTPNSNSISSHMISTLPFSSPSISSAMTTTTGISTTAPTYTVPSTPHNLPTSEPFAQMNTSMSNINSCGQAALDPISFPIGFPQNLPENRELLYQLGQRLMAMATLSDFMNSVSYLPMGRNDNNNASQYSQSSNSQTPMNDTSSNAFFSNPIDAAVAAAAAAMINQYGIPLMPGFPSVTTSAMHSKHISSIPALYSTSTPTISSSASSPQRLVSTSSISLPLSTSAGSVGPSNVTKFGFDRSLLHQKPTQTHHALATPGAIPTGLSGVSMRGNQKYSAYYQNQRKQGFTATSIGTSGNVAGEYFYCNRNTSVMGPASSSRRSGLSSNNPVLPSRYASRRFRGHVSTLPSLNPLSVDSKNGNQRTTGSRNTSIGLGGVTLPGYRQSGVGFKSLSTTSSLFNSSRGNSSPNVPFSKCHGPAETLLSSGQPTHSGTGEAVGTLSNRHKDTAFLCSCGKDFENLYVFIIHMKDTGHKPKSDHCDKDIPKLVRGQDMWINSETEQTREILRCMRCHQSFRSLPELTLHMMKTNHYSEIVYNDSGRLVFVNPDDHRRGPSTSSGSNPSLSSPGKMSPGLTASTLATRRGWKSLSYTPTTSTNASGSFWSCEPQVSMPSNHGENTRSQSDRHENKTLNQCIWRSAEPEEQCNNRDNIKSCDLSNQDTYKVSEITTPLLCATARNSEAVSPNTKVVSLPNELPVVNFDQGSQRSPSSVKSYSSTNSHSNKASGFGEISVLKQIETFVENSLPTVSKCLSVKTDNSTLSASSSFTSAPLSALTPTSEGASGCWNSLQPTQVSGANTSSLPLESRNDRKRRHSEANLATDEQFQTSLENPIDEQQDAKIRATGREVGLRSTQSLNANNSENNSPAPQSATPSPSKVTSTTGDSETIVKQKQKPQQLRHPVESPLSSLQKLVDTTVHKPVAPSATFSEPQNPHSNLPLTATLTVTKSNPPYTRPHSRTTNSQYQSGRQNLTTTVDSGSSKTIINNNSSNSINNQLNISSVEDPETSALSALYAYVERSSPCQSQESGQLIKDSLSPDNTEPIKSFDKPEFNIPRSMNSPQSYPSTYNSKPCISNMTSPPALDTMTRTNQLSPPILQQAAFCAAILSNLTAAPRSMSSQAQSTQVKDNPLKDVSGSLSTMSDLLHPSGESTDNTDGGGLSDLTNSWWRMLQHLFANCGGTQFPIIPPMTEMENSQLRDTGESNMKSTANDPSILREGNQVNRNRFIPASNSAVPPCSMPVNTNTAKSYNSSNSSSTTVPSQLMTSLTGYRTPLPATTYSHHFNSNLTNQPLGVGVASGVGGGLMSSIITKKAKCHFCGKPFANKGQVRLHISKNKCPCLLQQSCHVAALAAAFGGDLYRGGKQSFQNTTQNSGISKPPSTSQFSSTSGNQKSSQSQFIRSNVSNRSLDDGNGAPSALTLLKERFQNFDLSLASSQHNQYNQSNQQTLDFHVVPSSSSLTPQSTPITCSGAESIMPVNVPSAMTPWMSPGFSSLQTMNLSPPNSAANANHLAAMALLAQTLVQLNATNPTQGATGFSNYKLIDQQQSTYHQPDDVSDTAQQHVSVDALMPFLTDSGGLDREALLNSAKLLTQITNFTSRGVTKKRRTHNWNDQSGQSTSEGICDGQPRPTTTPPNGHL